jgi:hypothetical protein
MLVELAGSVEPSEGQGMGAVGDWEALSNLLGKLQLAIRTTSTSVMIYKCLVFITNSPHVFMKEVRNIHYTHNYNAQGCTGKVHMRGNLAGINFLNHCLNSIST